MRRLLALSIVALAIIVVAGAAERFVHGLTLVMRAADLHGPVRALANLDRVSIREASLDIPARSGPMHARVYAPLGKARYSALLVPGLHPAGITDARLVLLARTLAESNVVVVTPDIPELTRFEVNSIAVERIEEAAVWLAADSRLTPPGRVGLLGISVTGGLAMVAAGRPSLHNRLRYVFSFGGHDDIRNIFARSCDDRPRSADSITTEPDSYALAVALLNVAAQVVPGDQLPALDAALRRFLWASYLDRSDRTAALRELQAVRETADAFPEPSATLVRQVADGDACALEKRLQPFIDDYGSDPRLSPARSPLPTAPVYLLHGAHDAVIPVEESRHAAARLRGHTAVHLLVTDLLSHAAADQPVHTLDVIALAKFWGDLLAE